MIELKGIYFRYDPKGPDVLRGIDLKIEEGEFISIIGPNGSGKSTLAEIISCLLSPTRGDLFIDGINSRKDPWVTRQKVGLVFQNPEHQFIHSTVEEDVAFGPENLGLDPDEVKIRVKRALKLTSMEGYEKWSPYRLSAGQKQSVAIAGILAMEPKYLILDEPTSLLDPRGRKRVIKIIQELNEKKESTILLITQEMEEAIRAKRILIMEGGRIIRDGSPEEIFSEIEFLEEIGLYVPDMIRLEELLKRNGMKEIRDLIYSLLNSPSFPKIEERLE